jgi:peptide deformylase
MSTPSSSRREIVLYPDPVLLKRAAPVERIDDWVRTLVDDMIRIMRDHEGAGIAAPQVGESVRIFVVEGRLAGQTDGRGEALDRGGGGDGGADDADEPLTVYINPVLSSPQGGVEPFEEGCLSLPDIRAEIRRPPTITITAMNLEGQTFTRTSSAFLARVWQHEYDHLEGTLITDRMTAFDKLAAKRTLKELQAEWEERNPPPPPPPAAPPTGTRLGNLFRGYKRR